MKNKDKELQQLQKKVKEAEAELAVALPALVTVVSHGTSFGHLTYCVTWMHQMDR